MRLKALHDEMKNDFSINHLIMNAFLDMGKAHRSMLERCLQDTGVFRGQHHLLMCIFRHPDSSQKELAKMQNVSTAAVAVSLKKLEKGGYIERVVDKNDNRYNNIRITDAGLQVISKSICIFKETENLTFSNFTEEEKKLFLDFLRRAGNNIKQVSYKEREGE